MHPVPNPPPGVAYEICANLCDTLPPPFGDATDTVERCNLAGPDLDVAGGPVLDAV